MSRQGKGIASARRRVRVSTANRRMTRNRPDITLPTQKSETVLSNENHKLKVKTHEVVEPQVKVQIILPNSAPIQPPARKNVSTKVDKTSTKQDKMSAKEDKLSTKQTQVFFDIKASSSKKEKGKDTPSSPSRNVTTFSKKATTITSATTPQTSPTFIIPDTPEAKTLVSEPAFKPATPQPTISTTPKSATSDAPISTATSPKPAVSSTPTSSRPTSTKVSARTIKEEAIKKAVAATKSHFSGKKRQNSKELRTEQFGWQRLVLAFASSLVLVFAIIYFVNLNAPDVSLKVAAMQTGIDASYPTYTPRDFILTDITSENGKITLNFKNLNTEVSYSLVEENSAWDTTALYNNFVKPTYGDDYIMVREQGLTIYINRNANAVWVNGGVFYQISVKSGSLTKKQITTIATSL